MECFIKTSPKIDWQWMFVIGVLIGSLAASKLSKTFKLQAVPDMWQGRFGSKMSARGVVALVGGFIAVFCFFIGGIISANLLYTGGKKR